MPGRDDEVASDHMVEGMAYAAGRDDVKVCVSLKGLGLFEEEELAEQAEAQEEVEEVLMEEEGVEEGQWQQQWRQRGLRGVNAWGSNDMAVWESGTKKKIKAIKELVASREYMEGSRPKDLKEELDASEVSWVVEREGLRSETAG